jgi:hypothetical protein
MGTDLRDHLLSGEQITIGLSATVRVFSSRGQQSGAIEKAAGQTGTLYLVNGISAVTGAEIKAGRALNFSGPAQFFLAAQGATVTINYFRSYSAGATGLVAGQTQLPDWNPKGLL